MASVEDCEKALGALADRLASTADAGKRSSFDRTLSCTLTDLGASFGSRLRDGLLTDIHQVEDPTAQIRLTMSSDDLVKIVDGELNFSSAWTRGRVKIDAGLLDLIKLRSIF